MSIEGNKAVVDIDGNMQEVRIDLVDALVGDCVYCASGMALEKIE